jgi:hypothetical protein
MIFNDWLSPISVSILSNKKGFGVHEPESTFLTATSIGAIQPFFKVVLPRHSVKITIIPLAVQWFCGCVISFSG